MTNYKINSPLQIKFLLFIFPVCLSLAQSKDSSLVPDYKNKKFWAALPEANDHADLLPDTSLKNRQDIAEADVFYIHPTTYLGFTWNQQAESKVQNWLTDNITIQHQASIFNESCRVYAPRYRQATVYSFFLNNHKADSALNVAYTDVKKAFEFYLEHYNKGRPIVIAGHSQGSRHAIQLLRDFFDNKPLREKLIAAYLPGWVVKYSEFETIPLCDSASQTGCFVSWNSFVWGADVFNELTRDACCTNPLTWTIDKEYVPKKHHLGSVPPTFDKIDRQSVDTKCVNGKLWVHLPADISYWVAGLNYHVLDYNLFYLDIRENVKKRTRQFLDVEYLDSYR